jgi:hypothetical protein
LMEDQDPEVQPGFFEGDMAGVNTEEVWKKDSQSKFRLLSI